MSESAEDRLSNVSQSLEEAAIELQKLVEEMRQALGNTSPTGGSREPRNPYPKATEGPARMDPATGWNV